MDKLAPTLSYEEYWEMVKQYPGSGNVYHYNYSTHQYELNAGAAQSISESAVGNVWDDLTGKSNTEAQNTAASTLQEDAQAFNAEEAQKQRDWEAEQAQIARDYQTQMSNTAYQRSVADLQAAGLNPWLAVNNGASTPSAVSVSGGQASSGVAGAQASNVNMLQSLASTAVGIAALVKILKTLN